MEPASVFKDKNVLITGGLGFIGSNLAHSLVYFGAKVTILDSLNPLYGGNMFNIEDIKEKVTLKIGDIRDVDLLEKIIPGQDYLFSLAAQVSPIDSVKDPLEDLDVNCRGHLMILEACRKHNKNIRIFFSSSRMVYGLAKVSPITEENPTLPTTFYGIHKLTAEKYYLAYGKDHGIRSVIGRLTNPYGIRQQIKHNKYSIPGWFMQLALKGETIKIFGNGLQTRDFIYIDDLVDAIIGLVSNESSFGQIFNIGSGTPTHFKDMVEAVVSSVGKGAIEYVPWPDEYKNIETGDADTDIGKLQQATSWHSKVALEEGMLKMAAYYKEHKDKYLVQ